MVSLETSVSKAVCEGNGAAVDFPFAFRVWDASELLVLVTGPDGIVRDVTAQCGVSLSDSGGTVRYAPDGEPLPAGHSLVILRNMPFVQDIRLINGTRFDPAVIEEALDRATAERQQLLERVGRAVVMPADRDQSPEDLVNQIFAARAGAEASASSAAASEEAAAEAAGQALDAAERAGQSARLEPRVKELETRVDGVEKQVTGLENPFTPPTDDEPGKKGLVPAPEAMSAEEAANTYLSADGTWSDISSKFMQCGINSISFEAGTGGAPAAFTDASSSATKSTTFNFSKIPVTRQIGRQIASAPNDDAIVINEDGLYHVAGHLNISVGAYSGNVGMRTNMNIIYNDTNIVERTATCNQTTPDGGLRTNLHYLFWLPKGTKISFRNVYNSNSPTRTHQAIHVDILQIESGFPDAVKTFFDELVSSSPATPEEPTVTLEFVQSMKLAEFDSVMGDIDQALIRPVSDLLDALASPVALADDDTAPVAAVLAASRAKFRQLRELQIRNRKLRAKVLEAATLEELEAFRPLTARPDAAQNAAGADA